MITFVQQALDRMCIGLATASVRSGWRRPDQSERAAELLAQPDLFRPEVPAAQLEFSSKTRFQFQSPVKAPWDPRKALGRFFRARGDWQTKPTIILLHGWNGEWGYWLSFPWIMRALAWHGVNAIAFELPLHGKRRPWKKGQINNLISDDLVTMIEGVRHCLADTLAVRKWLREQGCPSVSVWGYSLGGWLAGLLAEHPDRFDAVVMMNAVARMDIVMATMPFGKPVRESVAAAPVSFEQFSLINHTPTADKVLIMEGVHDLFVPAQTLDELATRWPKAELWRMKHSHISINFGPLTILRAVRWVAARLKNEH